MKYIIVEGQVDNYYPIVFSDKLVHRLVADAFPALMPVRAGFCSLGRFGFTCRGMSESLSKSSDPEQDAKILLDAMLADGGYEYFGLLQPENNSLDYVMFRVPEEDEHSPQNSFIRVMRRERQHLLLLNAGRIGLKEVTEGQGQIGKWDVVHSSMGLLEFPELIPHDASDAILNYGMHDLATKRLLSRYVEHITETGDGYMKIMRRLTESLELLACDANVSTGTR